MRNVVPGALLDASPFARVLPAGLPAQGTVAAPAALVQAGVFIPVPGPRDDTALNLMASKIDVDEKGEPGGVAALDERGQVPLSQLPDIPTELPPGDGVFMSTNGNRAFAARLPASAFPAVPSDNEIPLNGVARVGDSLRYRLPDGTVTALGDFSTVNADVQDRLAELNTGLASMTQITTDAQNKLGQLSPLYPSVFPDGIYINGVLAVFGWLTSAGQPMVWWDSTGQAHFDGGLAVKSLSVSDALTLASASITALSTLGLTVLSAGPVYINGIEAIPILGTPSGGVAMAWALDGRIMIPGGLLAPGAVQGITYAGSRNRIDGVLGVAGPDLVGVGDSLTHGVGQTPYTAALANLTGRTVSNYGLGGQTSTEIAARFGASTTYLSVAGDSIPASGPVNVTVYDVDLLRTGAGASMTVSLYGVKGTLTRSAGAGVFAAGVTYTFTRTTAGAAVAVPSRVQIIPDTAALKEAVTIIWVGNNNYLEDANILRDVQAIIRTLEAMKARYLILTMLNGDYPGRRANDAPNTDYTAMMATNRNLMRLSNHVIDIQKLLPKVAGTDLVDPAYRVDEIHLNSAGYALVAGHIRDALIARGW